MRPDAHILLTGVARSLQFSHLKKTSALTMSCPRPPSVQGHLGQGPTVGVSSPTGACRLAFVPLALCHSVSEQFSALVTAVRVPSTVRFGSYDYAGSGPVLH